VIQLIKKFIPKSAKDKCWQAIDVTKIFIDQYIIPEVDLTDFSRKYSHLKIAFVKQENSTDLYTDSTKRGAELIFSSFHRSGPVALFTMFQTKFFIVKVDTAEECNYWKHRPEDCGGPTIETFDRFKNEIIENKAGELINQKPQKDYAIPCDEIDWDDFDLVITCDVAIPERIVLKFPKVKWAYMFFEPAVRPYSWSHNLPLHGYRFFLNQKYRTIKLNPITKKHEIDFPYHLHYYGVFHDLLKINKNQDKKCGVFLENRTSNSLKPADYELLESIGPIRYPKEELLENVIKKQLESKYFLSLNLDTNRAKIWGNGIIEAVACGCLAFGNPGGYANKDLFTLFTSINNIDEFIKKVNLLEKNPKKLQLELSKQRKLLNYLCFYRPMMEIIKR